MSSDNTNYIILPTQVCDAEAVRLCGTRAFGAVSFQGYIFPEPLKHLTPADELIEWRVQRLRKMLRAGDLLHFKCVPEDDHTKVIGYSTWHKPGHFVKGHTLADEVKKSAGDDGAVKLEPTSDLTAQAGPDGAKPPAPVGEKEEYPAAMDVEAQNEVVRVIDELRKKIWGDDANYWYLGGLAIDPDYQGRGLARKMIEMGLEWADAEGVPTYVESTPDAANIYPKFGFKTLEKYGFFDSEYVCEFQVRPPNATKANAAEAQKHG